jgi:hypothetical protein
MLLMPNVASSSYRWQDHVITPGRAAANLVATLVVLTLGAGLMVATAGASPSQPSHPHVAVSECTPSLAQLAKRPARPHTTQSLL